MALYVGGTKYAVTKTLYRGFYSLVIHGFAGTTITCSGTSLYIGSNETVTFKITEPGTYTFVANRKGETLTKTVVLDPKTTNYIIEVGMYIGVENIEYIQSTGTQYIDTGVFPDGAHTKIEVVASCDKNDASGGKYICGSRDSANSNAFCFSLFNSANNKNSHVLYGTSSGDVTSSSSMLNKKVILTLDSNVYTVKDEDENVIGTVTKTVEHFTGSNSVTLFAWNTENGVLTSADGVKIYSVKVYTDNVLVHDFRPVLDDTLTGCMYDRVGEQVYYNVGEGDFVAGPSIEYDELVYLESDGGQYIDTEYKPTTNTEIDIVAKFLSINNSEYDTIIGSTNRSRFYPFSSIRSSNVLRHTYGSHDNYTFAFDTNIHNIRFNTIDHKIIRDGVTVTTLTVSDYSDNDANLYMFACNYSNIRPDWYALARVYECKIYESGVLMCHFVPVRRKTGEVCMYDRVKEKFYYNKGARNFIAGPIFGYTELQYLESSGTQYIDTGVVPVENTSIEITIGENTVATQGGNGIFGNDNVGARWNGLNSFRSGFGTISWTTTEVTQQSINNIIYNKINPTFNGDALSISEGTTYGNENIYIYKISQSFSSTKVYSMKIYEGTTLIRDFIPVKRSDNVLGMLDKVNNIFYMNAGTGDFIAGPEKNN